MSSENVTENATENEPLNITVEFSSPQIIAQVNTETTIQATAIEVDRSNITAVIENAGTEIKPVLNAVVVDVNQEQVDSVIQNYIATNNVLKEVVDSVEDGNSSAVTSSAVYNTVSDLKAELKKMAYSPIEILAFNCNPSIAEIGTTQSVEVYWKLNKEPISLSITGADIPTIPIAQNYTFSVNGLKEDTAWELTVSDGDYTNTKSIELKFGLFNYYGTASLPSLPSLVNQDFITGLSDKTLSVGYEQTISVNAASDEYIWFACPEKYGTPSFTVQGITGGFKLQRTIDITNSYDHTEAYKVYRSHYPGLGQTTIDIS